MKPLLSKPGLLIVAGVAAALATTSFARQVSITALPKDALVVDVRTSMEFNRSHFEGAKNIPLSDIEGRLLEFGQKDRPVVVYCRSGRRSGIAKSILESAGFKQVLNGGSLSQVQGSAP